MGLFSFFAGKSPEEIEMAGDKYFKVNEFGAAKLEYEKAVRKAVSKFPEKANLISRLDEKLTNARESLARAHLQNSRELGESGNIDEAIDLLKLSLELTADDALKNEITVLIKDLHSHLSSEEPEAAENYLSGAEPFPAEGQRDSDEEYFSILINALPDDIRNAYQNYGPAFKQGYIALNNGDFETAAENLTQAMEAADSGQPLIPLELSTALANLGQYDRAREILTDFIQDDPEEVRAYQGLCDLYWIDQDYEAAIAVIEQCPAPLSETFPIRMLLGETLFQMGRYEDAEALFVACEDRFGENEIVSRALAKTYEAMGNPEKARDIYARILGGCAKCGVRTDPFIQQRYAELCFACGERSERLLNLYLSIMRDDPDNKDSYYQRIYELFEAQGNTAEADRYKSFIQ